jgi:hypothetical protein
MGWKGFLKFKGVQYGSTKLIWKYVIQETVVNSNHILVFSGNVITWTHSFFHSRFGVCPRFSHTSGKDYGINASPDVTQAFLQVGCNRIAK